MALSNVERQRKWIAKNRALHNERRRVARKKNLSGGVTDEIERTPEYAPPSQSSTLDKLRKLISAEQPAEPVLKPTIFRDDRGQQISEHHWNLLQKRKAEAKKGNYHLDDYCQ